MAIKVQTGCQNCTKCTGSVAGNMGRAVGRAGAAAMTVGMSELVMRKCRACGHLQNLHESTAPVVQQSVQVNAAFPPQPYPGQLPYYPPPPYPGPQPYPPRPFTGQQPQYATPVQYPAPPPVPPVPVQPTDRAARLRELKELREQDLITEEEFQAQRQEIIRSV